MTARPQQMSDGQEKSDDLIAELAKLMANNAQGPEAEAKPAPKLVNLNDPVAPASPSPIRIPGMDTPVMPAAVAVEPPVAVAQPAPIGIRIPGMDQPAPAPAAFAVEDAPEPDAPVQVDATEANPADAKAAEAKAAEAKPVEAKTVEAKPAEPRSAFDFGSMPPAPTLRPEPMANWQDREIPRPVPVKPVAVEPVAPAAVTPELSLGSDGRPAFAPMPPLDVRPAPAPRFEPTFTVPAAAVPVGPAASATTLVESPKPAPAGDNFDFDFGFNAEASELPPVASAARAESIPEPKPEPKSDAGLEPKPEPKPEPAPSRDPIADLIAAELDSVESGAAVEAAKPAMAPRPAPVQPMIRNLGNPQPAAAPVMMPRPTGAAPTRPLTAPVSFRPAAPAPRPAADSSDRFSVAPVFGLGNRPAAGPVSPVSAAPQPPPQRLSQPVGGGDPMDEIESLIGEAVRVELSNNDKPASAIPQPQPAPIVPPLTTGFAPRRSALKDNEPQVQSAEAAILAAAAASGANVGRIETAVPEEDRTYKRTKAKPEKRGLLAGGMRQYVGLAVAGTLLLAAGFGLYWVLGMGRGSDSDAPVLTADATPVKETPPATAATVETPSSVVFNEMDGVATDGEEQLVPRDDAETSVADVARTVGLEEGEGATEGGLANRKVRTVTVRPDGTIVSGDEAVAGGEELPLDRPSVPDLPGPDVQPSDLLAAVPSAELADPIAAAIAETTVPAVATETATAATTTGTPPVIDASIVAPMPMPRPVDRASLARAATPVDNLPLVDLVAEAPAAAVSPGGANAYVQLSSQRSEGEAQASLRSVQSRWSSLFGGNALEIQRADLGAKGVYYRVRLPASSLQEATQICASIKANGGDCFPTNG